MTTQTLELQAVTDEELMAVNGGYGSHTVSRNDDHGLQSLGRRPITLIERLR